MPLIIFIVYVVNIVLAITIALFEKRDVSAAWAWLLVMLLLPGIGLVLYLFLGRKLTIRQLDALRVSDEFGVREMATFQKESQANVKKLDTPLENDLVKLFLNTDESILTYHNQISIFLDGKTKFRRLFKDLSNAKKNINIEYFTIYDDHVGRQLRDILIERAKSGVQVRVLYDLFGSKGSKQHFFKELIAAGGEVTSFMPPKFGWLSFRVNFRNHRKIVVIDGSVGYIGGFNVGDQYREKSRRFGFWRDTHLRIVGSAVLQLQSRFFMDWNASIGHQIKNYGLEYFPQNMIQATTAMQVVTNGPENDIQKIKQGFIKMIIGAEKSIQIETPYFIPDDSLMNALLLAIASGVEVSLVIPKMPDHPFVYRATEYFAKQLSSAGAKVYTYQAGFMHVKNVVVDNQVVSIGSSNWDIRSFKLNFEANVFIYDQKIAKQVSQTINNDIKNSMLLNQKYFEQQNWWTKLKQNASRLLAPIL